MKVPLPGTAKRSNHERTHKVEFIDLDPNVRPSHISKPWAHTMLHRKWTGTVAPIGSDFVASDMWGEPGELYYATPLVSKRNNMLTYDQLDTEQGTADINALPKLLANREFRDGPRGVCVPSPFSTYIGYPSPMTPAQAASYPIWIGVYLMGNLHTLNQDGSMTTIVGRRPKAGLYMNLDDPESCMEWIGDFDIKFNTPIDVCRHLTALDASTPIYVADYGNNRIAVVRGQTVRSFASLPKVSSVDYLDENILYASAADGLYRVDIRTQVATKISSFNPFSFRVNSTGTAIAGAYQSGSVVTINLTTNTQTLIGNTPPSSFVSVALDRFGTVGPIDDFLVISSTGGTTNTEWTRFSFDGTRKQRVFSDKPGSMTAGYGYSRMSIGPLHYDKDAPHYPWVNAIHPTEGHLLGGGYGDGIVTEYRFTTPDDTDLNIDYDMVVHAFPMLGKGSVKGFPPCLPSLTAYRDMFGKTYFNMPDFDDLGELSDADLIAYIQSGMGGAFPRPDFTGYDLISLMYYIRKQSRSWMCKTVTLPAITKQVAPVISNVSWARSGSVIHVTWQTDIPSQGYVAFGPTTDVHRFTNTESGFSTTHTADLPYADDVTKFCVRVRNFYGSQTWANYVDCTAPSGTVAAPTTVIPGEYYDFFVEPITFAKPIVNTNGTIGVRLTEKDGQTKPMDASLKWLLFIDNNIVGGVNSATDTIPLPSLSAGPHALSLLIINATVLSPQLLRPTSMEYQAGIAASPTPTPAPLPTVDQQLADALAKITALNATVTRLQIDKTALAGKIAAMLQHIQEAKDAAA